MFQTSPTPSQRDLDRALALSALFQAASLVHRLSQDEPLDQTALQASIRSIFILDPQNMSDIFPDRIALQQGYRLIESAFLRPDRRNNNQYPNSPASQQNPPQSNEPHPTPQSSSTLQSPSLGVEFTRQAIGYALSLLYLDQKIGKNSSLMDVIRNRLQQSEKQLKLASSYGEIEPEQFSASSTLDNLGQIYLDTAGKCNFRIQVQGKAMALKKPENPAKIRAILLAGLRAAILWRQLGGRRWHLIFKRKLILECVTQLNRNPLISQ